MDSKLYTKDEIKQMLQTNDKAVLRGLIAIYKRQTEVEQDSDSTTESNGVGFNGLDAAFGSSLAKQALNKGTLSQKQLSSGRKIIMKYAGQLMKIANSKHPIVA